MDWSAENKQTTRPLLFFSFLLLFSFLVLSLSLTSFMCLPACLIIQTGGRSTSSPFAARTSKGSDVSIDEGAAGAAEEEEEEENRV